MKIYTTRAIYAVSIIAFGIAPLSVSGQIYNPAVESQREQVRYILQLVDSLPSNTDAELTQKIQLLQQALQLQLAVNNAAQTSIAPAYISILYPSAGTVGTRINFQGNNITVNDQIQILPPANVYSAGGQYLSAGVVDPGIGFTFPSVFSNNMAVVAGNYGIRIVKPSGATSNIQYFQLSGTALNYNNYGSWTTPSTSYTLTANSYSPTSVILSWPNALSATAYRLLEVLPNNQMNSLAITQGRTYQIDNLIAGSVHTYIVYGCTDLACSQVSSQSLPAVVSLGASVAGAYTGAGTVSSVSTALATNVTGTGATLNGTVVLSGYNSGTVSTWFEYAVNLSNIGTIQRTNQVISSNYGQGSIPVSATVFSLQPNTLYHFRLAAQTSGGTIVYSNINTFYTNYY